MSQFAYYSEPPAVFEGYAGPVVPAHVVYNGLGEPVGAIPLIAALAPLAAQLVGSLFNRGSSTDGIDGYGEYDGFGYFAGPEVVPARIVYNGLGEPVGAIPFLAALAPLAAKAAGFLAPLAAKAAGAIVPLATKAASAALPMVQNIAAQALPSLMSSLPGMLTSLPTPPMPGGGGPVPAMPAVPGPVAPPPPMPAGPVGPAPGAPMAPGMPQSPAAFRPVRRRRRRRIVRFRRAAPRAMRIMRAPVESAPPPVPMPPPVAPPPPVATDASGGVSGFGWPMSGLHACPRCGGMHGFHGCPF